MNVTHIHIENFRSYETLDLVIPDIPIQIFFGNNGAGKTNILESLLFCSLSKSPRISEDTAAIQLHKDYCRIETNFTTEDALQHNVTVGMQLQPRKKKILEYDGTTCFAKNFIGRMPTVSFFPDDLELFTGAPQRRRRFLDQFLCQISPEYTSTLLQYQKIVQQRNAALRQMSSLSDAAIVQVWDDPLCALGARIVYERLQLVSSWQLELASLLYDLGERSWQDIAITYMTKVQSAVLSNIEAELRSLLQQRLTVDFVRKSTSIGPHRDDFTIAVQEHSIAEFASRGQQRTAVLALLLLQERYIYARTNEHPLIILDDVFSELDENHQELLLQSFTKTQVWITTAQLPPTTDNAAVWNVVNGTAKLGYS
jgi:DNA replication and repair protein RecF